MLKTAVRILFRSLSKLWPLAAGGVLSSCVSAPPPYAEYNIARVAVRAAQDVDSARYASGLWNRADENYRAGERAFNDNDFSEAKRRFQQATLFAEKAENATRLKKFQTGDSFP